MQSDGDKKMRSIIIKVTFFMAAATCLFPFVNGPIALIGGFLFLNLLGHPYPQYNHKAIKWLLKIAVVGLGFGMNVQDTLASGKDGLALTIGSIALVLLAGFIFGYVFRTDRKTAHLISSGTAICGGSAIAAVAPIINASEKEMSVSLAVVFLLNSIALLCFPPIGHLLELTQYQFGLWSAIAIHDTSSVVGAAHAFGDEALTVATTVKMGRVLWIIPLSLLSVFMFKGKYGNIKIPWFILLFISVIVLNSFVSLPEIFTQSITSASKSLLVLTLFLVGAGLSIKKMKETGWKPLMLGFSLWTMISVTSLIAIALYFAD